MMTILSTHVYALASSWGCGVELNRREEECEPTLGGVEAVESSFGFSCGGVMASSPPQNPPPPPLLLE